MRVISRLLSSLSLSLLLTRCLSPLSSRSFPSRKVNVDVYEVPSRDWGFTGATSRVVTTLGEWLDSVHVRSTTVTTRRSCQPNIFLYILFFPSFSSSFFLSFFFSSFLLFFLSSIFISFLFEGITNLIETPPMNRNQ